MDARGRIGHVVNALKVAAKRDGHFVLATSELSKGAYRSKKSAENTNMLSSFKESGAIEYGFTFALGLSSQAGSPDLVDAEICKNRLGPRGSFVLRCNQITADVAEVTGEEAMPVEPTKPKELTAEEIHAKMLLVLQGGP